MCGITGVVGQNQSIELLRATAVAQSHRGPDNIGYFQNRFVSFSHQRLSIVDLSERSNQPMQKHGLVIVFNGEIYNYQALKAELSSFTDFITTSDTEVVLEAWRKWGASSLKKLRGMFAFSIHDTATGNTVVVRDPFGIKPLFYLPLQGGGLAFASELKAIEIAFRKQLTLNHAAVVASLQWVWLPESICIWKEVKKLNPGHYLEINTAGDIFEHSFWQFDDLIAPKIAMIHNELDAIDTIDKVLLDSVSHHLVADVPINAFLSGGLDSSLLVAMARKNLDRLDCYTIKFRDGDKKQEAMTDDAFYAARVAKDLNVHLNTIEVAPDISRLLTQVVNTLDEPIGDSAAINTLLISQAARDNGVKVLLSGMGADEMFGGYRKHLANLIAARYRILPSALRDGLIAPIVRNLPVASNARGWRLARWAKRFVAFASLPEHDAFLRSYTYYNPDELDALTQGTGSNLIAPLISSHLRTFNSAHNRPLLDRMCFTDVQWFMTGLNLAYSDRASMAASTELRVPFIDKEVMATAFRIDSSLKIKGRTQKYILKKVAERWLPKDIIYRPKSSFTMPLRGWIKGDLREMVDDYVLSRNGLAGRENFNAQFLHHIVKQDRDGLEDNAQRIWQLLTLEQWFRNKGV